MTTLTANGQQQFAAGVACMAISVVAVAIRFACKATLKAGIHSDDWWILASCLIYVATDCVAIWGLFSGGGGKEIQEITAELAANPSPTAVKQLQDFLMSLFVGTVTSLVFLYCAKMSACCLYRRIFAVTRYKTMSTIAMVVSTAWFIAGFVANMCICIPVDSFWNRSKPGKCLNFNLFFLVNGIFEVVIDTCILAIPIFAISTVQMALKTKIYVSGIFLLGAFSIVTCIMRISSVYQPGAEYVSFASSELWTHIHIAVTIVTLSIPVCKPLRNQIGKWASQLRDRYSYSVRFLRSSMSGSRKTRTGTDISGLESSYYAMDSDFAEKSSQESITNLTQSNEVVTVINQYEVSRDSAKGFPFENGVYGESRAHVKALSPV